MTLKFSDKSPSFRGFMQSWNPKALQLENKMLSGNDLSRKQHRTLLAVSLKPTLSGTQEELSLVKTVALVQNESGNVTSILECPMCVRCQ